MRRAGPKVEKKYYHVSIQKLAEAFEAQFFSNVKALEDTGKPQGPQRNMSIGSMSMSLTADESKFFENMTIHK